MRHRIIEAVGGGGLYLKALVGRFSTADWERTSVVRQPSDRPLLSHEGWTLQHFIIHDLSTKTGGAMFMFGGMARADVAAAPAVF